MRILKGDGNEADDGFLEMPVNKEIMKPDSEIQHDVMDELKWEPSLHATEIGVAVKEGVVTLSGTVDSYMKKSSAEKAARRVAGVKAVAEDIEVKYVASLVRNDTEIAQAVMNALKWHSAVNEEKIKVKVEDGVVTLDGEVDWDFQRRSAELQIENLLGVRRIINNIVIKTGQPLKDLKQKISAALHRSATIDAEKIRVESSGNKVILRGTVRSLAEKRDAEQAVWAAAGVSSVENHLQIETPVFAL